LEKLGQGGRGATEMSTLDKKRVKAVIKLEELGYEFNENGMQWEAKDKDEGKGLQAIINSGMAPTVSQIPPSQIPSTATQQVLTQGTIPADWEWIVRDLVDTCNKVIVIDRQQPTPKSYSMLDFLNMIRSSASYRGVYIP